MSAARDGDETTSTLSAIFSLHQRLHVALYKSLSINHASPSLTNTLGDCKDFLEQWMEEYVGRPPEGRLFREIAARNEGKARSIRDRIDQSRLFMLHCERHLGIPSMSQGERISEDDFRHDCFTALQQSLNKLRQPATDQPPFGLTEHIIRSPPSNAPSTPPAPSPRMDSSMSPTTSARASPISYEDHILHNDTPVCVKQEQQPDTVDIDFQTRLHYRKDSRLGSQSTMKEDTLAPIHYSQATSLAQIPSTAPYASILAQSSQQSPSSKSASQLRSPYQPGVMNGNDQQTVMMSPMGPTSPNIHHHPTLHPPLLIGPHPMNFSPASVFYDRLPNKPDGSSPPES